MARSQGNLSHFSIMVEPKRLKERRKRRRRSPRAVYSVHHQGLCLVARRNLEGYSEIQGDSPCLGRIMGRNRYLAQMEGLSKGSLCLARITHFLETLFRPIFSRKRTEMTKLKSQKMMESRMTSPQPSSSRIKSSKRVHSKKFTRKRLRNTRSNRPRPKRKTWVVGKFKL